LHAPASADDGFVAGAAVVMVDLSETPAAMPVPDRNLPPGPEQEAVQATPDVKEETRPPEETAEVALPEPEPPKPEPPAEEKQATAPPPVTAVANVSATTAGVDTPQRPSRAFLLWQSGLQAQIKRAERYPPNAAARREQGYVRISFTIDRNGHVLESHVLESSGFADLDQEFLAMVARAQPLPKPPAETKDSELTFTMGTRFSLK
jgi:protein TonB